MKRRKIGYSVEPSNKRVSHNGRLGTIKEPVTGTRGRLVFVQFDDDPGFTDIKAIDELKDI